MKLLLLLSTSQEKHSSRTLEIKFKMSQLTIFEGNKKNA